ALPRRVLTAGLLSSETMPSLLTPFPNSADASASMLPCHDAEAAALFFSERPAHLEQAKTLCAGCPLIGECRQGALDRAERCGVWGGARCEAGRTIAVKRDRGRAGKHPRPEAESA